MSPFEISSQRFFSTPVVCPLFWTAEQAYESMISKATFPSVSYFLIRFVFYDLYCGHDTSPELCKLTHNVVHCIKTFCSSSPLLWFCTTI